MKPLVGSEHSRYMLPIVAVSASGTISRWPRTGYPAPLYLFFLRIFSKSGIGTSLGSSGEIFSKSYKTYIRICQRYYTQLGISRQSPGHWACLSTNFHPLLRWWLFLEDSAHSSVGTPKAHWIYPGAVSVERLGRIYSATEEAVALGTYEK